MGERFFFALWPEEEQRQALRAVQAQLDQPGSRRVHPADFHLTLAFLGILSPEQLGCALAAADSLSCPPFAVQLDCFGSFPRARVGWCGLRTHPSELRQLVNRLWSVLEPCGFRREQRPYHPHVTLLRKAKPIRPGGLSQPIAWPVESFVLAHSKTGATPRYQVRKRWPLSP